MEIEKQVFDIFGSFLKDLSKTFPEIKNCLYRNYEKELVNETKKLNDSPKIKEFLKIIQENETLIEKKDISFMKKDIQLLEEICFKNLWEKNISDKTRETIWKYLQTFSIININLNSGKQLKEALETIGNSEELKKEDIKDKQTAKDLKKLKKLTEDVTQNVSEEETELDTILGGMMDSDIGKIAKEVASEINIEEMFGGMDGSDPSKIMQQMMNPEKIGSIFQNINKIIETKVDKGDLKKENLQSEAKDMYEKMSGNPVFGDIMNQMNPNNMNEESKESKAETKAETTPELTSEEKRKKLKAKINEKKKERIK